MLTDCELLGKITKKSIENNNQYLEGGQNVTYFINYNFININTCFQKADKRTCSCTLYYYYNTVYSHDCIKTK